MNSTISPLTAVKRIIAAGYNPLQFISRAYRDHSMAWAIEFEMQAHLNNIFGMGFTPAEAADCLQHEVNLRQLMMAAVNSSWMWTESNIHWLVEFSDIVINQY